MDGIARNTTGFDSGLTDALVPLVVAVLVVIATLLTFALGVEMLRRSGAGHGVVRRLDRIVPARARRIAAATLSLSITLVGPAPVYASDAPVRDWLSGTTTTTSPVATADGLVARAAPPTASVPPPVVPAPVVPAPLPTPTPVPPTIETVVVVDGDCLWAIAARRLGPDAANSVIDATWRAIYALNRAVIGDNPNLIFPGSKLELPPIDPSPHAAP